MKKKKGISLSRDCKNEPMSQFKYRSLSGRVHNQDSEQRKIKLIVKGKEFQADRSLYLKDLSVLNSSVNRKLEFDNNKPET